MSLYLTPHGERLLTEAEILPTLEASRPKIRERLEQIRFDESKASDSAHKRAWSIIDGGKKCAPLRDAAWETAAFHAELQERGWDGTDIYAKYPLVLPFTFHRKLVFSGDPDSQIEKAQSVSAFYMEVNRSRRETYQWRNSIARTHFSLSVHGDLFVEQTPFPRPKSEQFLFELKNRVPAAIPRSEAESSFVIYQDTSSFLLAILDFARQTKQSAVKEISSWKATLDEVGQVATNTTEAFGGTMDSIKQMLARCSRCLDARSDGSHSMLTIPTSSSDVLRIPIILDSELLIAKVCNDGETLPLPGRYAERRYSVCARFQPEDIPNLMRGTLKLFARDRSCMRWIMEAHDRGELFQTFDQAKNGDFEDDLLQN